MKENSGAHHYQLFITEPLWIFVFNLALLHSDKGDEDFDKESDENGNCLLDGLETDERQTGECAVCMSLVWNEDGLVVSDFSKAG